MDNNKLLKVGILFLVGIVLLIVFSITISKLDIFKRSRYYTVFFTSISGLDKGDPVRVSGMYAGEVASIELLPDTRIKIILKMKFPVTLYKDYQIRIEESSILGGNFVAIIQGTPSLDKIPTDEILKGMITLSGLNQLGQFVADNQNDIQNFLQKGISIVNKISKGEGSVGKLVNDDALYNNLRDTSESLKKISKQIEDGKGFLGKVIYDEKLSTQLSQAGDAASKVLEPVIQTKVFVGVSTRYFAESKVNFSDIYIKIAPNEWRYFRIGASFLSLNHSGIISFENKMEKRKDQLFIKPDIQIAYIFPLNNHRFTFRPGIMEGKAGAGIDWFMPTTSTGIMPLTITIEGRDAYSSVDDEKIDENLKGGLFRAYATIKLSNYFDLYLGANRLFDDEPEFMGGINFSYADDAIKSIFTFIGLAR